jgi:arylsulfatase A-like enzyme
MENNRRDVLKGALGVALSTAVSSTRTAPPERPNILWLINEDNNPFLGAYGDKQARTPNLDALAQRGILFEHAYSNFPVCAPSRFTMLTGVYASSCAPAQHMREMHTFRPRLLPIPI